MRGGRENGATRSVLFLCTGNSCRSQMAEALVNARLGYAWCAVSAGTAPTTVHPLAIRVLAEIDIDISTKVSKHVDSLRGREFDLVITVCGNAEQKCPVWLGSGRRLHIGFDDPAEAVGSDEERTAVFRRVRDEIAWRIIPLLKDMKG